MTETNSTETTIETYGNKIHHDMNQTLKLGMAFRPDNVMYFSLTPDPRPYAEPSLFHLDPDGVDALIDFLKGHYPEKFANNTKAPT